MKTEDTIRRERDEIFARMMKIIEEKGAEGMHTFRFVHLAVTYVGFDWILSNLPSGLGAPSPIEIDEKFSKTMEARKEDSKPDLSSLLSAMEKHLGVDDEELKRRVSEIVNRERPNQNNNVEDVAKESFMHTVEKIAESRKIKSERNEKNIKGSEEYKSLLKKLGMDKK